MRINYIIIRKGSGPVIRIIKQEPVKDIYYESANEECKKESGILEKARNIQERVDGELNEQK